MKKTFMKFVLPLALLFTLTACGTNNQAAPKEDTGKNLLEQIRAEGTIRVGTEGTYAPFTFHDKDGKLTGFDVDLMTEVAKRIGVKPQFVETQWDGMFAGLDSKRFDVVANEVGIRPDRQQKYDFSEPYIVSKAVVLVAKDNNTIHSFADLKGKKAAQSLTSNYADIARKNGAEIVGTEGFNQAIDLILSKRADATVNDSLSYLDLKKQKPDVPVKVVAEQSDGSKSGFLFRKGNKELVDAVNKALEDMKKDGTYLKISEKWFGTDVSK
ncbi:amino acid ABC transporter substrate-binding protein [Collibacillus ludicampi]|uniref:Amino acid ABC transporter substrate-binding protein n=1 Tax=Collibacillus ludicampi TaxID=2771369 RepID=A0AAV4LGA3_9BACL|nr:amino acid ABC transporter substrate-binding protein [Collibacillus ludicampi]GIM46693.1 amino acid ABC transporter substrate-binding protein [Collibacillus ludicampi]